MLFTGGACCTWIEGDTLQQPSIRRKVAREDHFVCVGRMAALCALQGDFEDGDLVVIGDEDPLAE